MYVQHEYDVIPRTYSCRKSNTRNIMKYNNNNTAVVSVLHSEVERGARREEDGYSYWYVQQDR